ncbi:MAG: efflux RND transporter permease subunit [Gemmataceae bacterium]
MNPILFALRQPISVMVAVGALLAGGVLAVIRTNKDIFPSLNLPVIYIAQPYGGMDAMQMEGLITNYYEYYSLYLTGIRRVESKSIQGAAVIALHFHPGTDMAQAMSEVVTTVNRARAFMPPGTVPPFVMRFDTGSVPVGYLVLSSDTRPVSEIQDQALFRVRPMFAGLPGVSAPPPLGAGQRTIVIRVDPERLRAHNLSPSDIITAVAGGNTVSPSGNLRVGQQFPIVEVNSIAEQTKDFGSIPLLPGRSLFLRDLATVEDGADIPCGYALANGRRAVYILVTKRPDASTLAVVEAVKANLPKMQAVLPEDIQVRFEFDQSPYVSQALQGLTLEMALGALLTGLMVLLFLRDWRSVVVIVLNIPLALLGAVLGLWLTGQTLNLMTLGGLTLSVGILVDEATVEVENIHSQMDHTTSVARAVRLGNAETAVPRLLAMLCILAVFLPTFLMQGAARSLFAPLALAVGFAMVTSYILSSTFVPVLCIWLLRRAPQESSPRPSWLAWGYGRLLSVLLPWRGWVIPGYLLVAGCFVVAGGQQLGKEIFPTVDTGQIKLRLRAPTGTRMERTEEITLQTLSEIEQIVGPERVETSVGYVGTIPSGNPINTIYQWMGGPHEALLLVALHPNPDLPTPQLVARLRRELPERLKNHGMDGVQLSFEPADIVNEVMSLGAAAPIEVVVSGPKLADNLRFAEQLRDRLEGIGSLRDIQFVQALDYPTVKVQVDREKAALSGATVQDVTRTLLAATSSSRFVVPMFWRDARTGVGYQVQVELPVDQMDSPDKVGNIPINNHLHSHLLVRDVANITSGTMPGRYDRANLRRYVSLTANVEGEDMGRVAARIDEVLASLEPPQGIEVELRGQIAPMRELFDSLSVGLLATLVVIFFLLTAYFQSLRLAFVSVATLPAVASGATLALLLTGTTLNLQSFMGIILAVGVAVANAILLVTFADRCHREGDEAQAAARRGASQRLRPILMTSGAMIAGMVPLALGLGEGGKQNVPLGLAVIGGLSAGTLATLLLLPCLFALLTGQRAAVSVSLDPDDPASRHYDGGLGKPPLPSTAR